MRHQPVLGIRVWRATFSPGRDASVQDRMAGVLARCRVYVHPLARLRVGSFLRSIHCLPHIRGIYLRPMIDDAHPSCWASPTGEAVSHRIPSTSRMDGSGLYAHTLEEALSRLRDWLERRNSGAVGKPACPWLEYVNGCVEMFGIVIEHADGTLRASHARIRWVITPSLAIARGVRRHYGSHVQVVVGRYDMFAAMVERERRRWVKVAT